jgi:cell division protein FtsQ
MDGGRRKLKSLDGPLRAVGGGASASGHARAIYSSRSPRSSGARTELRADLRTDPILNAAPARPAAPSQSAARPRRAANPVVPVRSGIGWLGVIVLFMSTGIYGATLGDHWQEIGSAVTAVPDAFARGSGFKIADVEVEGRKILTDAEIMAAIGYQPGQSLVFLDANAARERLMQNPLVVKATVRKLYPDKIAIAVTEREPFALWQRGEKIAVIGQDGTVIEGAQEARFADLPLLVGQGAETAAKSILAALEPYPDLKKNIYAAVRVGDRRWNLRLTNGMDVKLPEHDFADAIAAFVKLDKSSQLSDRDITEVDMRRAGTATVRLSDEAAAALAAKAKEKDKAAGT